MASRTVMSFLLPVVAMVMAVPWTTVSARRGRRSHFNPCPDQWVDHSSKCYHLTPRAVSLQDAIDTCWLDQGYLVRIEDRHENGFVEDFLSSTFVSSAWLGARYDESRGWLWIENGEALPDDPIKRLEFERWNYGRSYPWDNQYCSLVDNDGWWNFRNCSGKLPFLCEKRRSCEVGWYGAQCAYQCHCIGSEPCKKEGGLCPRGCAPGWTGTSCSMKHPMPDAAFHCFKTEAGDLRADLTVDIKRRNYRFIQAVGEDGRALPSCVLSRLRLRESKVYLTLLLPAAFADPLGANDTATNGSVTEDDVVADVNDTATGGDVTDDDVVGVDVNDTVTDGDVMVTVTGSWEQGTEAAKRDVGSADRRSTGDREEDCVASRTKNGTVTWLIEFKEFLDVVTGNDVTVEVTCDLEKADDMESMNTVSSDSENADPMDAVMKLITTSVYLTDSITGERAEHFHLGQRLKLHVDVEGLTDQECAFPHSCVVSPHGDLESEVQILDELGCGKGSWPVQTLTADKKGQFASNYFPAFSLPTTNSLDLKCQINVEAASSYRECVKSCRSP